jgi:hypothetical protein
LHRRIQELFLPLVLLRSVLGYKERKLGMFLLLAYLLQLYHHSSCNQESIHLLRILEWYQVLWHTPGMLESTQHGHLDSPYLELGQELLLHHR